MIYKKNIQKKIVLFYNNNGLKFPWRENRTPYKVMVSEFLLQRTKARNIVGNYNYFIYKYPEINRINFNSDLVYDVDYIFKNTGLIYRKRRFIETLKLIHKNDNEIPVEKEKLIEFPGIGNYSSAAIRIFGFNIKDTIIDSNIVRFFCRIYGIKQNDSLRRQKKFKLFIENHVPDNDCASYSYGLLDMGSLICKPKKPECNKCNLRNICFFNLNKIK